MSIIVTVGIALALILNVFIFFLLKSKQAGKTEKLAQDIKAFHDLTNTNMDKVRMDLNSRISSLNEHVISILQKSNVESVARHETSNRLLGDLQNSIGKINESSRQMINLGSNIVELQNILRAPKIRGLFGEMLLEDLLGQIFPKEYYFMQYSFKKENRIVDAAIKLKDGIIPIDAKFPLEYFNKMQASKTPEEEKENKKSFLKMIKKHILDISEKYILPSEGTFDFAMMYIPAESVYYEGVIKNNEEIASGSIFQYALSKKVIPVSPQTFYAYLQTLLFGLRGLKVEKNVREVMQALSKIEKDILKFRENFIQLGRNIDKVKNSFSNTEDRWQFLSRKLDAITAIEGKGSATPSRDLPESLDLPLKLDN